MASQNILLSDDQLLAEYVPLEGFTGLLQQRLAIGPDLLALLIRDGQIAEAAHGAHIAIGGIWRGIKNAIGGTHALRLMIADLKPFQLTTSVKGVTQDHAPVEGELVIDLQVNPEKPANILGLMKDHAALTKADILKRLLPHLSDRVFEALVRRVNALDLRGNVALQDRMQADVMTEVARLAGDMGLLVRSVSIHWAFNEDEIAAIQQRAKARDQEALEQDHRILQREVERETESTILKLTSNLDIEKIRAASDAELERMVLDQELSLVDARETGVRIEQMKVLLHELDLNNAERRDRLNGEIEAADHLVVLARSRGALQGVDQATDEERRRYEITAEKLRDDLRKIQRSIDDADTRHRITLDGLQRAHDRENKKADVFTDLDIADRTHAQHQDNLRRLQEIDLAREADRDRRDQAARDAETRRRIDAEAAAAKAEQGRIAALAALSPEAILAINAGVKPDVANILVEQARAKAANNAELNQLLRDGIAQARGDVAATRAHDAGLFNAGMQGAAGVAQGVGAAVGGAIGAGDGVPAAAGTVECPACHKVLAVANRFCTNCGHQLRV